MAEGIRKNTIDIAQNLIRIGLETKEIAQVTNFSEQEIDHLRKTLT